jgi:hypothetical protein
VAAAAVAVFGLAACSSTGSDSGAVAPTTAAQAEPTPSPAATTAAAPHARDYVLTAGPETAGLVVDTSPDTGGEPDISDAEIASCVGVPVSEVQGRSLDKADGPDFKSSDQRTNVSSSAEIYPAADVTRDRAVLLRPQTPGCLGRITLKAFQQAAASQGGRVTLDSAQGMTAPAGATGAARVIVTAIISGVRVRVAFDFFFLMSGRVESTVFVSQINGIPSSALEQRLISQVAGKLARQ